MEGQGDAMVAKIEQDHHRFRQIVKGRIRDDLKKFLQRRELIAREGRGVVSIPVYDIDRPTFRYGDNASGVGMGDGEGDASGSGAEGGDQPGQHIPEVDVSLEELADILAEELELPRIKPRGERTITSTRDKYTGIRPVGPASLRHFKRTYREALKRQIMADAYDPDDPVVIPIKRDMRFRSWREVKKPHNNAAIVYMMDVSGSMGDKQKEIVRLEAFWIDTWLRRNYKGIESRYIVHDVGAAEVDKKTFFSLREDGGTRISSAFKLAHKLVEELYPPSQWNVYLFHFSDGDNSSEADNRLCCDLLKEHLLPACNVFGYCQVASAYGSGNFINVLHEAFPKSEHASGHDAPPSGDDDPVTRLITSRVNGKDDIIESLRTFFAPGR
ncbi:MAG: DUF444 family protein [Planctomycetota bacterium]